MSSPRVWQSSVPGLQVPLQQFPGAQHANPFQTTRFTLDLITRDLEYDQSGDVKQVDLAAVVENLTEAFKANMLFMRSEFERVISDSRQREERYEWQLQELRNELRSVRECLKDQKHHSLQQQLSPPSQNNFPRPQWSQKRLFQKIEKSDDTPNTNIYIDECAVLNKALEDGASLAIEGAKCSFVEHTGNLWEAQEEVKVHAVGSDFVMGVGVARDCAEIAGRPDVEPNIAGVGDIITQESEAVGGTIWHLVTKEKSSYKLYKKPEPFLGNVRKSFKKLAEEIKKEKLEEVAMSFLCSGSDRMNRVWILKQLYNELKDVSIKVHFYNKVQSKRWRGCCQLFSPVPRNEAPAPSTDQGAGARSDPSLN
ncbi:uncharacterized protein LOC135935785 [Cloeon dipterum]|uniref:uncharacterized protein LOC135935785 n=1 Tax=Cloeon dipterum TaxID=197152 RepID=UPI00321F97B8